MGRKIYWTISDKQKAETEKFFVINKIQGTIEDMIIDNMDLLAKNIDTVFQQMVQEKKMTQQDLDGEKLPYVGKLPKQPKNMKLKVIVLTGDRIFNGITKAGKINNFLNRKEGKIVHETLDIFINAYMQNEFAKISAWMVQHEINEETRLSKEETKKELTPVESKS